ncbi:MAG: 2-hydroxyacid dehydrogenase [Pseudomonadota bacterium]
MTVLLRSPLQPPAINEEIAARFEPHLEADGLPDTLAAGIDVVITKGDIGLPSELMASLPDLKLISVYGVGTDAIDLEQAARRGVRVTTTPDVLTDAVAELAIALMLAGARRVAEADRYVRVGSWGKRKFGLGWSVFGETVGILGYGRIGQRIGGLCRALGMSVLYSDLNPRPGEEDAFRADAKSLSRDSRVLIIAAAGGPDTEGLVDRAVLQALGPEGLLVNVARGSVVNETDLAEALEARELGSAALDVFADEPNVPLDLLRHPQLVLTPHIASATLNARTAMGRLVIDNVAAFLNGDALLTPLDLSRLERV